MNKTPLLKKIARNACELSPKQLVLAKYLEKNYKSLAYTTMTELARRAGVSETTVVRFVYMLGYKGFPEFMTALRAELSGRDKKKTSSIEQFDIDHANYKFPEDACRAIFSMEIQIMAATLNNLNKADYEKAVDMLYRAKSVLVVGCGANACCAKAMEFALQVIRPNVFEIEHLGLAEESCIRSVTEGAVCIAFTTPRYPAETEEILSIVHDCKIPIIGVSNSVLAPSFPLCEVFLQVMEKYITYIDSNAAYMALIHALTFSLCLKDKKKALAQRDEYNVFVRRINFYVNGADELADLEERL